MLAHTRFLADLARLAWIPYQYEDDGVDYHYNRAKSVAQHVQENTPHVELGCRVVSILKLFVRSAAVNLQIQAVTVTSLYRGERRQV